MLNSIEQTACGEHSNLPLNPEICALLGADTGRASVPAPSPSENRVFIFCPPGGETEAICALLRDRGVDCIAATDPRQLVDEIGQGLSSVLLSDEFFRDTGAREILATTLAHEPEWSDLPVIALLTPDESSELFRRFNGDLASVNLTVIERPARTETIARTVMCALRARKRQYQVRDFIDERIKAEGTLRRTEKLESIGILAGGVAHDFNNLLTGILGNAALALSSLRAGDPARGFIGDVIGAGERAAYLTRQLLAYAGKSLILLEPLEMSSVVRSIEPAIRAATVDHVEIRFELSDNLPNVFGDSGQMNQIVMNLVTNAVEAIPPGEYGAVTVSTRLEQLDEAYIASSFNPEDSIAAGRYVCLEVRDNGVGMVPEILARIFDPFFTTKFTGRGLGLAAVAGLVRGHKGAIRVWSEPGKGSAFRVLVPASEETKVTRRKPVQKNAAANWFWSPVVTR